MSDLTALESHLMKHGITLEPQGRGNTFFAMTPQGKRLELIFRQRNEGNRFKFQIKRGTYSQGDHVFMVCHHTPSGNIWVLPRRKWEQVATEAGYCPADRLSELARECLFDFKALTD
jgi:hypothetical protein